MNLQNSVQEAIKQFEKTLAPRQVTEIEQFNQLFEAMKAKGLVESPAYNLQPIGTIFPDVSKL